MSSEESVPEEVWGLIFGKVDSVRDMGRLARVSRRFNRLITNAITQVRVIRIGRRWISLKMQLALCVDEDKETEHCFAELRADAPARALSLVEKVAREADNLEGVVLDLYEGFHTKDQQYRALASQCLRLLTESDKPKLKAFCLFCDAYILPGDNIIFPASADFIASKAATLKSLTLDIWAEEGPLPLPFLQALQSCTQLETVKLDFYYMSDDLLAAVLGSVVAGLHGLKSLQLVTTSPIIHIFRRNDLQSLRLLGCQFETMENYVSVCQASKPRGQRFSMGDHPLQNIQELTLNYCPHFFGNPTFLSSFPFEDFPHLRLLRLDCLYAIKLPRMVAQFLSLFRQQPGLEKALDLQVQDLFVDWDNWPEAPPQDDRSLAVAIQEAVGCFCPTFHSDPQRPNKKLIFQSGNATFNITVESYYGRI